MYFTLKAVARSLLLPPASCLLLAMIGAYLLYRRRRGGGTLLGIGLVSLWLFSTPLVADALLRWAEHYPAFDVSQPTQAQAIVIIGGGGMRWSAPEFGGPAPENGLLERLMYGAFLARRTGLPILISGAPQESVVMRASLERDFGIEPRWVEDASRDTFQNARFSARILKAQGVTRIILVTNSTHIWRAAHEFQDAGFDVVPAPHGLWGPRLNEALRYVPDPGALMRSNLVIYELLGEPARRLQEALGVRERLDSNLAVAAHP